MHRTAAPGPATPACTCRMRMRAAVGAACAAIGRVLCRNSGRYHVRSRTYGMTRDRFQLQTIVAGKGRVLSIV